MRALLLALLALPANAEAPLSAAEFEARVTGRVMIYADESGAFGIEEYHPGRRVTWAFAGDDCTEGTWYPAGEFICFVYENLPGAQCWTFHDQGGGLVARFAGDPPDRAPITMREVPGPMFCPGPKVGV